MRAFAHVNVQGAHALGCQGQTMNHDSGRHVSRTCIARHLLTVYASLGCPGWNRTQALVALLQGEGIPGLELHIVDLEQPGIAVPDVVAASPTWVLDGQRIALGNPDPDALLLRLVGRTGKEAPE